MQQDASLLRAFRKAKGLTQEALAEEWGVSVRTTYLWTAKAALPSCALHSPVKKKHHSPHILRAERMVSSKLRKHTSAKAR